MAATGPAAALRLIRHRNFGPYFVGNAASASGTWFQNLAASVYVFEHTHSPFLLGVLQFGNFVPVLLLAPWGGSAADRFDRKQLLLVSQIGSTVLSGALAALTWAGFASVQLVHRLRGRARDQQRVQRAGEPGADRRPRSSKRASVGRGAQLDDVQPRPRRGADAGRAQRRPARLRALVRNQCRLVPPARPRPDHRPAACARARRPRRRQAAREPPPRPGAAPPARVPAHRHRGRVWLRPGEHGGAGVRGDVRAPSTATLDGHHRRRLRHRRDHRGLPRRRPRRRVAAADDADAVRPRVGIVGFALSPTIWLGLAFLLVAGFGYLASNVSATSRLQLDVAEQHRGRIMALWSVAFLGFRPLASLLDGALAEAFGVRAAGVVLALPAFACAAAIVAAPRLAGYRPASASGPRNG